MTAMSARASRALRRRFRLAPWREYLESRLLQPGIRVGGSRLGGNTRPLRAAASRLGAGASAPGAGARPLRLGGSRLRGDSGPLRGVSGRLGGCPSRIRGGSGALDEGVGCLRRWCRSTVRVIKSTARLVEASPRVVESTSPVVESAPRGFESARRWFESGMRAFGSELRSFESAPRSFVSVRHGGESIRRPGGTSRHRGEPASAVGRAAVRSRIPRLARNGCSTPPVERQGFRCVFARRDTRPNPCASEPIAEIRISRRQLDRQCPRGLVGPRPEELPNGLRTRAARTRASPAPRPMQ